MDERRDPGEFYPGGRVIGRDGVAPAQTVVNWSDIHGKPDLSDIAALGAADSLGTVKQTVNTVVSKFTSLLIGALFVVGSALADPEPLFAKADDIPGNQQIMTNTQEYVDAKVAGIPVVDTNAVLASAKKYADAATNGIPRIRESTENPGWAAYADHASTADGAGYATYSESSGTATDASYAEYLADRGTGRFRSAAAIFAQLDAASETNAMQQAALTNCATTADATLTPVYSNWALASGIPSVLTGNALAAWRDAFGSENSGVVTIGFHNGVHQLYIGGEESTALLFQSQDGLSLVMPDGFWPGWTTYFGLHEGDIVATRSVIGYTLGSQTNMVLAATNATDSVTPQAVTNIVRDLSLGGIWDSQLEVWWTPRMRNGSLTYEATTNVNLNAEQTP